MHIRGPVGSCVRVVALPGEALPHNQIALFLFSFCDLQCHAGERRACFYVDV